MLYESRYSKKDERLQKLAKPKEHYIPRYNLGLWIWTYLKKFFLKNINL